MRWPWQDKLDVAHRAVEEAEEARERVSEENGHFHELWEKFERIRAENGFTRDAREAIQGVAKRLDDDDG